MLTLRAFSSAIAVLALVGFSSVASAATITSAVSVSTNMGEALYGGDPLLASYAIDQSGLSANYVSGVTDFDLFLDSSPVHASAPFNDWVATSVTGYIDFDLGSVMDVDRIAIWNFASNTLFSVTAIDVLGDSVFLGDFDLTVPPFGGPASAQVISLGGPVSARTIRFNITDNNGAAASALGEVAFSTGATSPVPEPGAALVFGVGMMLVAYRNKALA